MSAAMLQIVLGSDLRPTGLRMVAVALAWRTSEQTGVAWPGLDSIARMAGVSHARAKQVIRQLQLEGVIVKESGPGGPHSATARYRFTDEWLGKQATRVAGLPGKQAIPHPGSRLSLPGNQATPKRNERKAKPSLSLKERRYASDAPRGRAAAAPQCFGEVDYEAGVNE